MSVKRISSVEQFVYQTTLSVSTITTTKIPTMANSKFASISADDMDRLLATKDAASTQRAVKRSVTAFRQFLGSKGESTEFEVASTSDLNEQLKHFFASVRSQKGEDVKTATLNSYKYGISKYLKENCKIDINNNAEFPSCRQLFKAKVTDLKKSGKGSTDHKPPIAIEDLHKLYDKENLVFNTETPYGLQKKVWFDIMYFLCRRGRENLREMSKSTFGLGKDAAGVEFVYQIVDEADKNHR